MKSSYYLQFENEFRGEREEISKKFAIYNSLIDLTIKSNTKPNLIDIGCGRGESLENWRNLFDDYVGIESDKSMVDFCRKLNLNVLEKDALNALKGFSDNSVSIITIFHVIEHLSNNYLYELLDQCYRVLSKNGVLIMETPSIDNILVSTKFFYIDNTHINHINPDGLSFTLKNIGFAEVKDFYIHPGPLINASPIKLTRILNGVAQDVCFIASKTKEFSDTIFHQKTDWQYCLDQTITTLKAASEFDLQMEKVIHECQSNNIERQEINKLINFMNEEKQARKKVKSQEIEIKIIKEELNHLRSQLNRIIKLFRIFYLFVKPLKYIIKVSRKILLNLSHRLFNLFAKNYFLKKFLLSDWTVKIINIFIKYITGSTTKINKIHIQDKIDALYTLSPESIEFNNSLKLHYKWSKGSQKYKKLLVSKLFKNNK